MCKETIKARSVWQSYCCGKGWFCWTNSWPYVVITEFLMISLPKWQFLRILFPNLMNRSLVFNKRNNLFTRDFIGKKISDKPNLSSKTKVKVMIVNKTTEIIKTHLVVKLRTIPLGKQKFFHEQNSWPNKRKLWSGSGTVVSMLALQSKSWLVVLRPFDTFKVISSTSVTLSTLFLGKPPRQFTSTFFMTKSQQTNVAGPGLKPVTPWFTVKTHSRLR